MKIPPETVAALRDKFEAMVPHLDERQRRLYLGAEAQALGHGGIIAVATAAGVSTVSRGCTSCARVLPSFADNAPRVVVASR
ncbi:hypothetical protein ACFQ0G_04360 [Streptomyces chiangmaiensis]